MDVARPINKRKRTVTRTLYGIGGVTALAAITVGLSHLKPAAPSVSRATVWVDTVKRGPMVRQVRGLGTLVPEEIRWIPAATEGRVERILIKPGTAVKADSVLLELSNPELENSASEAEWQLKAAEADYSSLKVRLQSQLLDQKAAFATSEATAQVMNRFLNRLPTVTIREGHRVKVYLTSDLELPAYEERTPVPP